MSQNNLPQAMRLLRKVDPSPIGTMLAGPFQSPPQLDSWVGDSEADAQAASHDLQNLSADFDAAFDQIRIVMDQLAEAGKQALLQLEQTAEALNSSSIEDIPNLEENLADGEFDFGAVAELLAAEIEALSAVPAIEDSLPDHADLSTGEALWEAIREMEALIEAGSENERDAA